MNSSIVDTLRSLARGLVDMAENRLKLVQLELGDEADRLGTLLARLIVTALSGLLTVQFAALLLLALVWDTPWRVTAMFALMLFAAGVTAYAWSAYLDAQQRTTPIFDSTLGELRKDRSTLASGVAEKAG
jgi:uncharacterized membrane protein YqjE